MPSAVARASRATEQKQASMAPSIASFTRVSKSHVSVDLAGKKAVVSAELATAAAATAVTAASVKKRKASTTIGDGKVGHRTEEDIHINSQRKKRACRRPEPTLSCTQKTPTPRKAATTTTLGKGKPVSKSADTRKAAAHRRSAASATTSKTRQVVKAGQVKIDALYKKHHKAKLAATDSDDEDAASLPPHLADLVRLHRAFVKTVVVRLAHARGSSAPLDIRELAPDIARSWRRRQVTVEDVRRCVAMETTSVPGRGPAFQSPFIVADYGEGKVCVELRPGCDGSAVDEARLCRQFRDNLKNLCAERAMENMADDTDGVDLTLQGLSLAELPQADLTDKQTTVRTAALLAKGYSALSTLKKDMAAKRQGKEMAATTTTTTTTKTPLLNPDGTKMGLLDRLRHKQLAAANAPLPLSGAELERRAALSRVTDVAATISMLSLSTPASLPRQAFAMSMLVGRLRDSLRVPMSREEGARCLGVIAREIAPDWLRIVTIGGTENVVVQRTAEPVSRVIEERVRRLM